MKLGKGPCSASGTSGGHGGRHGEGGFQKYLGEEKRAKRKGNCRPKHAPMKAQKLVGRWGCLKGQEVRNPAASKKEPTLSLSSGRTSRKRCKIAIL